MICDKTKREYTRPQTKGLETHPHELDMPISRVTASTLAQDLVPVTPMKLPTGLLFYLDSVYTGNDENDTDEVV